MHATREGMKGAAGLSRQRTEGDQSSEARGRPSLAVLVLPKETSGRDTDDLSDNFTNRRSPGFFRTFANKMRKALSERFLALERRSVQRFKALRCKNGTRHLNVMQPRVPGEVSSRVQPTQGVATKSHLWIGRRMLKVILGNRFSQACAFHGLDAIQSASLGKCLVQFREEMTGISIEPLDVRCHRLRDPFGVQDESQFSGSLRSTRRGVPELSESESPGSPMMQPKGLLGRGFTGLGLRYSSIRAAWMLAGLNW